jgi:hypothetical protein
MEALKSYTNEKTGETLNIYPDEMGQSPREWDNLCKMVFFGNHRHLGDKHNVQLDETFTSREDFMERGAELVTKQLDAAVCIPIHLYSHSGTSISTSYSYPYNCRWDSGTIGFAVVTKEAIRNEYSVKRVTKKLIEKATSVAEAEVETLNQYISGEVYGFEVIDKDGKQIDSCWGFFGCEITTNGILDHVDEDWKNIVVD